MRKSEDTISRHLNDYLEKEKLKPENGGSESRLNDEQAQQLIEPIFERTYPHAHQIVTYISDRLDIKCTVSGLN